MRRALLIAIAVILVTTASGATINGIVTDPAGSPVAHASIAAVPRVAVQKEGTVGDRPNPWMKADSHGRFSISLPPGRYKIEAKDEIDGYPDPVFLLSVDAAALFPEITVAEKDIKYVRVVLGKQGGVLTGEIVDRDSRHPIPSAKITIADAANLEAYVEVFADKEGHFQFAVPSKPLLVSASAVGYNTAAAAEGGKLTLSGGERREVLIELQHQ